MPLAVLDVYHQFHFEIVQSLIQHKEFDIGYIILGVEENFHGNKEEINSILLSDLKDVPRETINNFIFPENLIDFINEPYELANEDLNNYTDLELLFLKLSDRAATIPISVQNRRKYYFFLLNKAKNMRE